MSKIIDFEQQMPVRLTRVVDADSASRYLCGFGRSKVCSYAKHTWIEISSLCLRMAHRSWNMIRNMGASSADVPYRRPSGWCDGIMEAITLGAIGRTIRCIRNDWQQGRRPAGQELCLHKLPQLQQAADTDKSIGKKASGLYRGSGASCR